jgi:hypothetical protein
MLVLLGGVLSVVHTMGGVLSAAAHMFSILMSDTPIF